jgi:hypothetical protein
MQDFSFQGKVYLGARLSGGKPGALRWVGDAPKCDVALATDSESRKESYSGNRLTSAYLQKGTDVTISLTLNWANADNLVLGLYGTALEVTAGSVTDEALPSGLVAGDFVTLDHGGVSALVITDSAGTPATLVADTDYRLDSANGGTVEILNVGTYVQPFKAAYSHTASADVTMFTSAPPERYLMLDGVNTVDNSPVRLRLYRVRFNPLSTLPLINESFGQIELTGAVMYDSEAAADDTLGGFGKIEQPTAVS